MYSAVLLLSLTTAGDAPDCHPRYYCPAPQYYYYCPPTYLAGGDPASGDQAKGQDDAPLTAEEQKRFDEVLKNAEKPDILKSMTNKEKRAFLSELPKGGDTSDSGSKTDEPALNAEEQKRFDEVLKNAEKPDVLKSMTNKEKRAFLKDLKTNDDEMESETNESTMQPAPATLLVKLPADAKLLVDDESTTSTGTARLFESPKLPAGEVFCYTLKAQWIVDGETRTLTKRVEVRAGKQTRVDFDFNATAVVQK